jgi:alpha-tubulin suppressor-like RCC1 family protein
MCVTFDGKILSWGTGSHGRLGQGTTEDILSPSLIPELSGYQIDMISAGESHSACITSVKKLYTWGNNIFGRLGHGIDANEQTDILTPTVVEYFDDQNNSQEIISVSCGAFHTFCITQEGGYVYAFG